ncbi:hypothetical protein MF271_16640 [Deinococcus sp. KNUC1210]|uniref:hypothetical protein n=1 Tax=Deinococcus sp. KNUC1210 TaxID=2917691 RepID=UPI001EEFAF96|nr:hypothetical protein [Deinococcus sp. KNUC1210]ULH15517.1 hypothetical protein MF271_16640 [Deinococcus sp. KNUC1210]
MVIGPLGGEAVPSRRAVLHILRVIQGAFQVRGVQAGAFEVAVESVVIVLRHAAPRTEQWREEAAV